MIYALVLVLVGVIVWNIRNNSKLKAEIATLKAAAKTEVGKVETAVKTEVGKVL